MVKYCSRCGARVIPGAKFCRSCGTKIEVKEQVVTDQTYEDRFVEDTYSPREEIRPEPKVKVELSKEEEESLLVLSEIIPIQKQIETLKKDKDTLEIKFRVEEEITEKDYNTQLKKINTDITSFEKDIEEKRKVMASLSLLNLVQDVIEMRERQEKLEEIFKEGRIQESTYDRLKKEYKEKEKATKAQVDEEEAKLKQFRRNLVDEKEEISSSKEELFARYSVSELTEKEYRDKIKELESRNTDGLIAAVDEVIARMARV
ncbi:MAG TPA: zinc ribbon domain-containing protein [Candidatus Bathyarchaeia archaeon]|nr:zinc ribbon domain-containing protein [Candidatus Bathyarchaeia archaeon]